MRHVLANNKLLRSIIATVLIASFVAVPVTPQGEVKEAEAVLVVEIATDTGDLQDIWNSIQNAYTAFESSVTSWYTFQDWVKEHVLDPLFWGLAEAMITGILNDMISWVNSGFEGDPQFITNFEAFLEQAADEAVGEFIYGSELGFLCDPFELDIRIALSIQYATDLRDFKPQCTLTEIQENFDGFINGTFVDGGWKSWFEFTQGRYNSPISAYSRSREVMEDRAEEAQAREGAEAAANEFWLAVEICGLTDVRIITSEDTEPPEQCLDGTPGSVVNNQVNEWLGITSERLAFADEINELVTALFSQLTNQALMGVNGLLGLGGSDHYTDFSFGEGGSSSYLSALRAESNAPAQNPAAGAGVFQDTINDQQRYHGYQDQIISRMQNLENTHEAGEEEYPGCYAIGLSGGLASEKQEAELESLRMQASVLQIRQHIVEYQSASGEDAARLIQEHLDRVSSGQYVQRQQVIDAQLFVQFDLPNMVDAENARIASERERCQRLREEEERRRQAGIGTSTGNVR